MCNIVGTLTAVRTSHGQKPAPLFSMSPSWSFPNKGAGEPTLLSSKQASNNTGEEPLHGATLWRCMFFETTAILPFIVLHCLPIHWMPGLGLALYSSYFSDVGNVKAGGAPCWPDGALSPVKECPGIHREITTLSYIILVTHEEHDAFGQSIKVREYFTALNLAKCKQTDSSH